MIESLEAAVKFFHTLSAVKDTGEVYQHPNQILHILMITINFIMVMRMVVHCLTTYYELKT